jgi:ABC-type nitrate/sulfonate/bicarbonate transport system substrate-binding protein
MKKYISFILVILLVATVLTGCGKPENKDKNDNKEKVRIVLDWLPNTNHTGLYVAQEKGYFEAEGLDVEIVQPPEGGALSLVASENAQFAISFQEEIATAITADQPLPVTAVAAIIQHNTSGIISLKSKGMTSPKAMEGKKYATWDAPVEKAILKNVITKDGGDYSKVNMVPSTVTDVLTAIQTDIDAVWIYYAWDGVAAEVKGVETNYFAFKDIDPVLDFYTPVIASSTDFLKNNPDTAKKFMKAVSKGYDYSIKNPKDSADILVKAVPEIDKEIAIKSQEYLAKEYQAEASQWGIIDQARWDAFYKWMNDNKLISKEIKAGEGFTNEYLPKK